MAGSVSLVDASCRCIQKFVLLGQLGLYVCSRSLDCCFMRKFFPGRSVLVVLLALRGTHSMFAFAHLSLD